MLDPVHDTQRTLRELVGAMSFPGRLAELGRIAARIEPIPSFNPSVLLIALTLLDREVGFHVASGSATDPRLVSELTFARPREVGEADYVFITEGAQEPASVLRSARVGTLVSPHLGATVVFEVGRLATIEEDGNGAGAADRAVTLTGPGIPDKRILTGRWTVPWPEVRNRLTAEFPVGIDLLLVDGDGRVCAVPRSTRVAGGGEAGG